MFARFALVSAVALSVVGSNRAVEPDEKKLLAQINAKVWRISKIEMDSEGVYGSVLVTRTHTDGFTTTAMWLGLGKDVKFSLNGVTEGVKVKDLAEGMAVTFEFGGLTKSEPPISVGLRAVSFTGTRDVDSKEARDALRRQLKGLK